MPFLPAEVSTLLDDPITLSELQLAIGQTKLRQAPGPDGLTIQYYKTLLPSLGLYMVNLFNNLETANSFHETNLQAHILVIPKEGKDTAYCGSYRPISLLYTDLKLFTKIRATRLQQHLLHLIHLDQVGFVPSWESRDNTTKVLNLLHVANTTNVPCVFLGTNAEKALDRVHWSFMFSVLWLGRTMLHWISCIYSNLTARVRANGILSDPFAINSRTRQGCPLSPLPFALALKPFLSHVCLNPDVTGIKVGDSQRKVSAYVDNMMFTLTNLPTSLPNLLLEFETYGALSNLKMFFTKSKAMGVGIQQHLLSHLQASFKLKWTNTALKYLGKFTPPKLSKLPPTIENSQVPP